MPEVRGSTDPGVNLPGPAVIKFRFKRAWTGPEGLGKTFPAVKTYPAMAGSPIFATNSPGTNLPCSDQISSREGLQYRALLTLQWGMFGVNLTRLRLRQGRVS